MIVFFIILIILFFISLLFLILCASNLEIEIDKLWFDSTNKKREKLQHYLFNIKLKLFDKITWLKIKIDRDKVIKIKNSKLFTDKVLKKINKPIDIKEFIFQNKKDIFKSIKELNIKVKQLDLELKLSLIDYITTSFSIAIIATIISIFLANNVKKYDKTKYNYIISPIYKYKPILKIKLNCIINLKIVHIMNVIYIFARKRSVMYDERASNRRTYVCSND